jgi:hypothetical protein
VALTPPVPARVDSLACRGCGAPLQVRAPGRSLVVACGGCGAVLDAQDADYRMISKYEAQRAVVPTIPLGTRGRLKGETWEVIGYMARRTRVADTTDTWFEHLLHNPTGGFRWLVEYNGHWTLAKPAAGVPSRSDGDGVVEYLGQRYRHFQTAQAEATSVVGEFPWQVKAGELVAVEEYVDPPRILSHERSDGDATWSVGEYVEGAVVWNAFALPGSPPERVGIGAAQPSPFRAQSRPMLLRLLGFVAAAVLVHLLFLIFSQQRLVLDAVWEYHPRRPAAASRESEPFALAGRTTNLVVEVSSTVAQSWAYFTLTLVNEDTGAARTVGREVAYYFGRDSDGSWTEGAPWDRAWLPSVAAGRYRLVVEPESPGPMNYRVRLTRDVPRPLWLWVTLGLLGVPPLIFWWRQWRFEYRRWEDSDHPMSGGSDDGGDDD